MNLILIAVLAVAFGVHWVVSGATWSMAAMALLLAIFWAVHFGANF